MDEINVSLIDDNLEKEWNNFVNNHYYSTYCHKYNYRKLIEKTYKNKTYYLIAKKKDKIIAILPLVEIKTIFGSSNLVSLAHTSYGGLLTDYKDLDYIRLLFLKHINKFIKFNHIEERLLSTPNTEQDIEEESEEVSMIIDFSLFQNIDDLFLSIKNKRRNLIRKSFKSEFLIKFSGNSLLDFYNMYLKGMNRLGTPAHPIKFFYELKKYWDSDFYLFTSYYKNKAIGAMIGVKFKNKFINLFAAVDQKYNQYSINDFMYWKTIEYLYNNSFNSFDFGRSKKGTPTYKFKKEWTTRECNIVYKNYFFDSYLNKIKYKEFNTSKLYRSKISYLFVYLWRKLPNYFKIIIGHQIRKYIP